MLWGDVVADALEDVLEMGRGDLVIYSVHVEDLEEGLALGGLELEGVRGGRSGDGLHFWVRICAGNNRS